MTRMLSLLTALAVLAGGCGAGPFGDSAGGTGPEGPGDGLTVVATVFPLSWLAHRIAPGADVSSLGPGAQEPHDPELSPRDRASIETADVVVTVGDIGFQPQVESAVEDATGEVVSVAEVAGEERLLETGAGPDDHAEEGAPDDHADETNVVDPHLWFDAAVMADVAESVGEAFASADPSRADAYTEEAAQVGEELSALDGELDALLADCRHDTALVSHEAYAYLLEPRGLTQVGISGAEGHSDASPQRLAELTRLIRQRDLPAVGAEPVEGRDDAEALASEAGVDLVEIHPLSPVSDADHPGYPAMLRAQGEAFASLLECT